MISKLQLPTVPITLRSFGRAINWSNFSWQLVHAIFGDANESLGSTAINVQVVTNGIALSTYFYDVLVITTTVVIASLVYIAMSASRKQVKDQQDSKQASPKEDLNSKKVISPKSDKTSPSSSSSPKDNNKNNNNNKVKTESIVLAPWWMALNAMIAITFGLMTASLVELLAWNNQPQMTGPFALAALGVIVITVPMICKVMRSSPGCDGKPSLGVYRVISFVRRLVFAAVIGLLIKHDYMQCWIIVGLAFVQAGMIVYLKPFSETPWSVEALAEMSTLLMIVASGSSALGLFHTTDTPDYMTGQILNLLHLLFLFVITMAVFFHRPKKAVHMVFRQPELVEGQRVRRLGTDLDNASFVSAQNQGYSFEVDLLPLATPRAIVAKSSDKESGSRGSRSDNEVSNSFFLTENLVNSMVSAPDHPEN